MFHFVDIYPCRFEITIIDLVLENCSISSKALYATLKENPDSFNLLTKDIFFSRVDLPVK